MEEIQSFDVNTGEQKVSEDMLSSENSPKKSKKKLIIGIIIAIVIAAAAGIGWYCFSSAKGKIPRAVIKTFGNLENENKLLDAFNIKDLIKDNKYTVLLDVDTSLPELGETSITSSFVVNKDVVELSGDIDISYVPTVEYTIQLDENQLRASCPMIPDRLFFYNYTGKNKGYINDILSTDLINSQMKNVYGILFDNADFFSISDNIVKFVDKYKELEFKEIDSKEYSVDGKDVECSGYETKLSKRLTREMFSSFISGLALSVDASSGEYVDELNDVLGNVGGMDLKIYLYDDEIAAIIIIPDDSDKEFELCFEGGDYRLQTISLNCNGINLCRLEGSIDGNKETASLVSNGIEALGYEYDFEEGGLTISLGDESFGAKLISDERKFSFKLDYIDFEDSYLGCTVAITTGSKLSDMDGEEFDLGNASEDDINELMDEIEHTIRGLTGQE